MKKIIMLIIGMVYCLTSFSQQSVLSDIVNISLPKGAERITKEKLQASISTDNKKSVIDTKHGKGTFYKVNGLLMQLNVGTVAVKEDYLEQTKKGFDSMARMDGVSIPNYFSEIKSINNYKVLIIHHSEYYSFICVSNTNKSGLNGILEFKKSDKGKAETILNELLHSIKFKQ